MRYFKVVKLTNIVLLILLLLVFSTGRAYAYLDPGTGSYILQILAAGVLGGLFALKTFWGSIVGFFSGIFSREKKNTAIGKKKNNGKQ